MLINQLFISGLKAFWKVFKNEPVTDYISRINSRQKAPSISSFNVSTIYTNIIHSSGLRELINICFKAGLGESVAVEN